MSRILYTTTNRWRLLRDGIDQGTNSDYWYPSKDPLTERWSYSPFVPSEYHPYEYNGILTVGGVKANGLARYFNDMQFAITREGPDAADTYTTITQTEYTGTAPTSDPIKGTYDFFRFQLGTQVQVNSIQRRLCSYL